MFSRPGNSGDSRGGRDRVFDALYPEGFPEEARSGQGGGTAEEGRAPSPRATVQPFRTAAQPAGAWRLAPLGLLVMGAASILLTQEGIGYAWDEAYYYEPSRKAARWIQELLARPTEAVSREAIDEFWEERSEHPSFHKLITGAALYAMEGNGDPLYAMRVPAAVLFGATLALIFTIGSRIWDPASGFIAAIAYAAMPRIFGHAHFSSMETPLNFSMLLVFYCYLRGLSSPLWATFCGISFGLLLATKINAFFVFPPLLLWGHLFARRRYINNLFSMIVLGPVFFVVLWPWLWHDTPARILDYLSFHATHQQTALYFMGRVWGYGRENAPWFYPSTMLGATLPLGVLFLTMLGLVLTVLRIRTRKLPLLVLLLGLVMWGVASAPSTPKYDGIRLFLPLFPCLALLAGGGASAILNLTRWAGRRSGRGSQEVVVMACVLVFAIGTEGAWGAYRSHPYLLSYFNPLVGGIDGAEQKGFEVTYWGEALNDEVIDSLNRMVPDGGKLKVLSLHELNFLHLQRWGQLKSDIQIQPSPPYDMHVLLHRKGFYGRPERALAEGDAFPPLIRWSKDGVPLISLYQTGPAFERYWPNREKAP